MATSPIQVPWIAGREALDWVEEEGVSHAWIPLVFVGELVVHATAAALHLGDLAATPIHFVAGNGPARVYDAVALPLARTSEPLAGELGELFLWTAAGAGGAVVAWWFGGTYVPHLFRVVTG